MPPKESESVAVPVNLIDVIAVLKFTPGTIEAKPLIAVAGVNSTFEIIATVSLFAFIFITGLDVPVESVIVSDTPPVVLDAVGPTNNHSVPE